MIPLLMTIQIMGVVLETMVIIISQRGQTNLRMNTLGMEITTITTLMEFRTSEPLIQ